MSFAGDLLLLAGYDKSVGVLDCSRALDRYSAPEYLVFRDSDRKEHLVLDAVALPTGNKVVVWLESGGNGILIAADALTSRPEKQETQQQNNRIMARLTPKQGHKVTNSIGMEFVSIPPGTFMMGSPPGEPMRRGDEILHQVKLTQGFYLQTTEVTQGQWHTVMGSNPSR